MSDTAELAARAAAIGVGATLLMDVWALLLRRAGVPSLNLALLGRWVGHVFRGRVRHTRIASAAPIRGERWIGWIAHYAIGITFSALLLRTFGLEWAGAPTVMPALGTGILTVVAPLFILQPGMGAGIASRKTPTPVFNSLKSLITHTVFGLGMYLAALAAAWAIPVVR